MGFEFKLSVFLNSMIWVCFVIIDKITPYNLWKELVEERNVALAIVVGATAIGISMIVAAAIHG
jgi:putative membrane protein